MMCDYYGFNFSKNLLHKKYQRPACTVLVYQMENIANLCSFNTKFKDINLRYFTY